MGIHYGLKRTGIAVSDPMQIIATALQTVATNELMAFIKKYTATHAIDTFVVGLPLKMNGTGSEITPHIEGFVKRLQTTFAEINVARMDARFTSKLALSLIAQSGMGKVKRQNKGLVDSISATIILQNYMQWHHKTPY